MAEATGELAIKISRGRSDSISGESSLDKSPRMNVYDNDNDTTLRISRKRANTFSEASSMSSSAANANDTSFKDRLGGSMTALAFLAGREDDDEAVAASLLTNMGMYASSAGHRSSADIKLPAFLSVKMAAAREQLLDRVSSSPAHKMTLQATTTATATAAADQHAGLEQGPPSKRARAFSLNLTDSGHSEQRKPMQPTFQPVLSSSPKRLLQKETQAHTYAEATEASVEDFTIHTPRTAGAKALQSLLRSRPYIPTPVAESRTDADAVTGSGESGTGAANRDRSNSGIEDLLIQADFALSPISAAVTRPTRIRASTMDSSTFAYDSNSRSRAQIQAKGLGHLAGFPLVPSSSMLMIPGSNVMSAQLGSYPSGAAMVLGIADKHMKATSTKNSASGTASSGTDVRLSNFVRHGVVPDFAIFGISSPVKAVLTAEARSYSDMDSLRGTSTSFSNPSSSSEFGLGLGGAGDTTAVADAFIEQANGHISTATVGMGMNTGMGMDIDMVFEDSPTPADATTYKQLVKQRALTMSEPPWAASKRMNDMIGSYTKAERILRIARFFEKRRNRVWSKKVKYDVRKTFADSRIRVKGRFVKKEEEKTLTSDTLHPSQTLGGIGIGSKSLSAKAGKIKKPRARSLSASLTPQPTYYPPMPQHC